MRGMRHTIGIILGLVAGCCIILTGCNRNESHESIVMMAVGLDVTRENWLKKGRPKDFDFATGVHSSTENYYSFTNAVESNGNVYRCCFAVRSKRLRTPGAMAITEDGVILWIYDKDGRVIIWPQKNGIERDNHG